MSEIIVIKLTDDADLLTMLQRKLEEYETRLIGHMPERDPDATYKRDILKHLLETDVVIADELRSEAAQQSWFDAPAFLNALGVVNAYNDNSTELLRGGTGLA